MSFRFDSASFTRAVLLFAILILLATLGQNLGWVRSFLGDVLAVAWVFYSIRTFVTAKKQSIAIIAFTIGAALELIQYLLMRLDVQIPNRALRIIFGATPDWWDILAYATGAILVLSLDFAVSESRRRIQDKN